MTGKHIRLNKLFSEGKNAVVVAIDHGEFDGPLPGMIDLPEVIKNVEPAVDAILLSPGMLPHCGHAFGYKGAPMSIVRMNWSTHFCFHWNYSEGVGVPVISAADAAAAGAEVVLVCLTLKTGSEVTDAANVEAYCRQVNEAKKAGLPVVGEYFPAITNRLSPDDMHDQILKGCRVAAELGADLIKTFYTYNFKEVTEACPVPILGLGAEKTPTQLQALELAEKIVQDGGRGVVFGRNAIQVANPPAFQRALMDVVKNGASAVNAVDLHGLVD